ncbi:MAG: DUF4397 domain-containing protein [Woeseia sp.]|nr:DUF4397 domain-containing protein [Woeseia sp.]
MNRFFRSLFVVALAIGVVSGCSESDRPEASGKAALLAINGIVDAPDATFLIEERSLGATSFGNATQASRYDDLSYTFNFDIFVPGEASRRRLASQTLDVVRDKAYLFVLGGSIAAPSIYLFEEDERLWDGTETVFELSLVHANNTLGAIDVYFAEPGVAPVAGNEIASVNLGERVPKAEYATGEYVLTVTAAGEPQTILYTSETRTWTPARTDTVVILDSNPSRTGGVTASLITAAGGSVLLTDPRFPPAARVLHAAEGVGNIDLAENSDFDNLIASNLAFAELTGDLPLTAGTNTYTFTDAGNQGAPLVEEEFTISAGANQTLTLVGPPGEPDILATVSVRRPFAASGRLNFVNAASSFEAVDIYLLDAGTAIDEEAAYFSFAEFKSAVPLAAVEAKDYELTITLFGEKTVLAGPIPLAISNRELLEIFILDTADPSVAQVKIIRYGP